MPVRSASLMARPALVWALALGLGSTPALADSAATPAPADAAPEVHSANDIIVSANRRDEKLGEIGAGISVVTAPQLDNLHATSLKDYLGLLPGVSLISKGGPGHEAVAIRGISPQGQGATVATYIDDIPFSASGLISQPGAYFADLDPADMDQVEVLKGPQGTLYGASALGGVIKYVTKQPSLTKTQIATSEDVSATEGGQPSYRLRASVSTPLVQDKLALRVSGYYRRIGGYVNNAWNGAKNINDGNDWGVHGTLRWQPLDTVSVSLTGLTQKTHLNGTDMEDLDPITGKPLYGDRTVMRYTPESIRQRTDLVALTIKADTSLGTLVSSQSYSYQKTQDQMDATVLLELSGLPLSSSLPGVYQGDHSVKKYTDELRFNSRRIGLLEFGLGVFIQHEDGGNVGSYGLWSNQTNSVYYSLGLASASGGLTETAGYANATLHLTPTLDVTGGWRHSHIAQDKQTTTSGLLYTGSSAQTVTHYRVDNDADTWLADIRWHPASDVLLYARAASGYRPGGVRSLPPGAPASFGTTYKSDSIWSYEAGTKISALHNTLTLSLDGFWIDWKDIQTLVAYNQYTVDGNAGTARSRGVEAQASWTPLRGLTLSGSATYTDARFTQTVSEVVNGQRLYGVPKVTLAAQADYGWALTNGWQARVGGDVSRVSSEVDLSGYTLPGHALVNLHLGASHGGQEISFYIKNVFNKRAILGDYYYYPLAPWNVTITRPRTFGLSATQRF